MLLSDLPDRFWDLPSSRVALDIDQVDQFPLLAECLREWHRSCANGLPRSIDPLAMPRALIKGISLIEWREEVNDWVFRLSATLFDEGHGRVMTGSPLADMFSIYEHDKVRQRLHAIVASGEASLARREFLDPKGRVWAFVRLILPLSSTGERPDSYAMVLDPDTFGRRFER